MQIFKSICYAILAASVRLALSLRYRIVVKKKGFERLDMEKGTLFLPNHVALADPVILLAYLWARYRMRPIAIDYVFSNRILRTFSKMFRPLLLPNFGNSINQLKIHQVNTTFWEVSEGLGRGESFLLYPSGHLKLRGKELLGGASAARTLIEKKPDANVVLIRITGLWGSLASSASLGKTPDIKSVLLKGLKVILKNGVFFAPRRRVIIEMEANPSDFPREANRTEFNLYLERWYNQYPLESGERVETEPLNLVPYAFWNKKDLLRVFHQDKKNKKPIFEETKAKIYSELRKILANPDQEISPEMNLIYDLNMDSLNIADLMVFLLRNAGIEKIEPSQIATVQDVLEIAENTKETSERKIKGTFCWPKEIDRPQPSAPEGATLQESFLIRVEKMGEVSACADDITGVMSYSKLKRAVLVLSQYFRGFPESKIAVMLPASAGTFLTTLAIQFAGKIPVMLNWTLGPRYLEEMMQLSGAQRVISSWRFLDRIANVEFGKVVNQFELLEDIRQKLTWAQKLRGALLAKRTAKAVLKSLKLDRINPNDPCAVLFTSGTEASPKCVPLSHRNILENARASFDALEDLKASDTVYATLPPFHSFGYACTGMLALLSGVKIAFYPNPTDVAGIREGIGRWQATHFPAPPSFLSRILSSASDEELKTVRIYLSGAEKAPQELIARIRKMASSPKFIEGYGITECSATVAINRPSAPARGVGKLLANYRLRTIHPETLKPLPEGTEGEICLKGPCVFNGYWGNPRSAFIQIEGEDWYQTGDLGYQEADGSIFLSGRLKRFAKIGGEMISLAAVEEALKEELLKEHNTAHLAICVDEKAAHPSLVLFTEIPLEREEANQILKRAGFSNLIKISSVATLESLPLLATGKIDYRHLQNLLCKNKFAYRIQ